MDSLAALRLQLAGANQNLRLNTLGDIQGIRDLTGRLKSQLGEGRAPSGQAVLAAIQAFMTSGQLPDFRALKLVCYGMAQRPQPSGRSGNSRPPACWTYQCSAGWAAAPASTVLLGMLAPLSRQVWGHQ
jgi:hypothetical protein